MRRWIGGLFLLLGVLGVSVGGAAAHAGASVYDGGGASCAVAWDGAPTWPGEASATQTAYSVSCSGIPANTTAIYVDVTEAGNEYLIPILSGTTFGVPDAGSLPSSFSGTNSDIADGGTQASGFMLQNAFGSDATFDGEVNTQPGQMSFLDNSFAYEGCAPSCGAATSSPTGYDPGSGGAGGGGSSTDPIALAMASSQMSMADYIAEGIAVILGVLLLGIGVYQLVKYVRKAQRAA